MLWRVVKGLGTPGSDGLVDGVTGDEGRRYCLKSDRGGEEGGNNKKVDGNQNQRKDT
jgi:hypothetical protein